MFDILAVTLLIILALVLAVLEIFFLPGITIAGICSVLFYGGGIYYAYSAFGTNGAVITLFIAAVTTIAVIIGFMRSRSLDKMSLHTEISSVVPSPITPDIKVGDMGVTLSRLNPMGKIIVGIHTIEARADNELIDEDTPVKIIRIEPTVVIVCKETENEKTGNNINTSKNKIMVGLSVFLLIGIIAILAVFFYFVPFLLWISARVSGVRISLIQLFLMRIRKVPPQVIVRAMIEAHKAGLKTITRDELEAHYLAGGHVERVVHALVSASKANIDLGFQMATAIDLAGRDVFEAVQMSVNPKVIDTPPVTAVAKDGIQLIAKARVTVRANIRQLVGGAGEDTILARVGEGIVSSIGSSESHKQVLENPDSISKLVLKKGLDSGTAFEILSIDIADIDIGKNIGATLQMDQAQADKNIAQAKAEERRAMAIALEQEMKAKAQEARAKVIEAEAEVPRAMAEAFRSGNLGIMDYYKMKNVEADTAMRESIAKPSSKPEK